MIHVIGMGLAREHRSPRIMELILKADLVASGRRLLDELEIPEERRLPLTGMDAFAADIRARAEGASVCVLADGDPLLYGLGASLLRYFAPGELTFHPNVSALQTACARFGLPWHDCRALSLHGRSDRTPLFAALTHDNLVALYTDHRHSPDAIAGLLLERGVTGWRMNVAEALGGPEERLSTLALTEAAQCTWHALNMVVLERTTPAALPLKLGFDEEALAHTGGLMTKQHVRALALSLLRLPEDAVMWDLGAGSGAVSLEAARLLGKGHVVAVERQEERVRHIRENVERTGAWLVEVVHASLEDFLENGSYRSYRSCGTHGTYKEANKAQNEHPACLGHTSHTPHSSLPTHIFLGGGASAQVLAQCAALLSSGGRMVVAAVLLSTLETARAVFHELGWPLKVHQLMHHGGSPLAGDLRLVPSNPVFLLETRKPSSDT
ncbi:MAG: bifunctional cobalt-precorrin-7 (C(5))-methyltransferase/cobalt-precorrin-6B (C(15))-methyltransferase [Deltaproteobacteria bacterium HGW-Deltaproteobacteria-18]|jgi:precorrin-6Y C5,15-methyltransferase (decarboxylating)|nr:MAG: bifunctional cobalt-precorrin-7 (C(5))-methyltransferase/cobalt-precorrin-6B (C(15))-methyltransferase [Deltaproteobacteria bacterium HGW-Deltaproteobacteria-18]